jgi:hypothetical protein
MDHAVQATVIRLQYEKARFTTHCVDIYIKDKRESRKMKRTFFMYSHGAFCSPLIRLFQKSNEVGVNSHTN